MSFATDASFLLGNGIVEFPEDTQLHPVFSAHAPLSQVAYLFPSSFGLFTDRFQARPRCDQVAVVTQFNQCRKLLFAAELQRAFKRRSKFSCRQNSFTIRTIRTR